MSEEDEVSQITIKSSKKFVIGIDYGTTTSGFGFSFLSDKKKEIKSYNGWENQPTPYIKTLSKSLYIYERQVNLNWLES
jgi:hypothetical protein